MALDHSADDSGLSRRDFLERTAYAAGVAGAAGLSADTILTEAAQATTRFRPLPKPRNVPIDHFVLLMMENRSFDHYFGWLRGYSDGDQTQRFPNPEGELVATRHASTLGIGRRGVEGVRPSGPRARLDLGPRAAQRRLSRGGQRQRRVRPLLLQPRRPRLHSRGGAELHALRPVLLLDPRGHLAEPVLQVVRAVGRAEDQHARARRQQLGDDLRPRARRRADREVLLLGPALRAALRQSRHRAGSRRSRSTTRTRPPASCRTSRSWTRPSATAAAATGSPRTSIRSATSGSVRRSRRTWSTPSPTRPTTAAARSS